MSVEYRTRFIGKRESGEEKHLDVYLGRQFGAILDELAPIGSRIDKKESEGIYHETPIRIYRFQDIHVLLLKKACRKECESSMIDMRINPYRAASTEVYDRLKEEIASDLGMIEYLDEEISYIEYIGNGVVFHFLDVEGLWDTGDIIFEVAVC